MSLPKILPSYYLKQAMKAESFDDVVKSNIALARYMSLHANFIWFSYVESYKQLIDNIMRPVLNMHKEGTGIG
jgi:hypothetical protein